MQQPNTVTPIDTPAKSTYLNLLLLGLVVNLITAFFSVGYHHPDEHFQVLEFAGYKLGHSPINEIPWEFSAQCRAGLLPFIAFCLAKLLALIQLYDPFLLALLLRLITVVGSWSIIVLLTKEFLSEFTTRTGGLLYVGSSFLLWFIPYLSVRFSAENIAQLSFFLAALQLHRSLRGEVRHSTLPLLIAGLLLGISVFIRLQMGFALMGLGLWMLISQRISLRHWATLFIGGFLAIAICVCIDRWLYGVWTFSPYNYFAVNILQDKASEFGVSPWWQYFLDFILYALPPISIGLLLAFFGGLRKNLKHPFTFITIAFVIGHMLIAHKELRFIFPILPAFIFLACMGIDGWLQRHENKRTFRVLGIIAIGINIMLLLFRSLMPAYDAVSYYSFIYSYAKTHKTEFVSLQRSPYNIIDLEANFYKPTGLKSRSIMQPAELLQIVGNINNNSVLYLSRGFTPPEVKGLRFEKAFSIFPSWLTKFNPNNWQERSNVWVIYAVQKMPVAHHTH